MNASGPSPSTGSPASFTTLTYIARSRASDWALSATIDGDIVASTAAARSARGILVIWDSRDRRPVVLSIGSAPNKVKRVVSLKRAENMALIVPACGTSGHRARLTPQGSHVINTRLSARFRQIFRSFRAFHSSNCPLCGPPTGSKACWEPHNGLSARSAPRETVRTSQGRSPWLVPVRRPQRGGRAGGYAVTRDRGCHDAT